MATQPDVKVYVFCPKGAVDYERCHYFKNFLVADTIQDTESCINLVRDLHKRMESASIFRKKIGTKDTIYRLRRKKVDGYSDHPPTICVLDEFWRVVHHQSPKSAKDITPYDTLMQELKGLAETILREGRSYGFFLLTISQSPRAEEQRLSGAQDSYAWRVYGSAAESMAQSLRIPELFTDSQLDQPGYFYYSSGKLAKKFRVPHDE